MSNRRGAMAVPQQDPVRTLCPPPEELREYFGAFGEIESVNVKTDPTTGRSRGFAFLVFSQPETVEKVSAVRHWGEGLGHRRRG